MYTRADIQQRLKDAGLPRLIPAYMRAAVADGHDTEEFNSGMTRLLDYYFQDKHEYQFEKNVSKAGLPYVVGTVSDVELQGFTHLKWYRLQQIRCGSWAKEGRSVLIHGNTIDTQLQLCCAVSYELMLQGMSLRCYSLKDLTYQLLKARTQAQSRKYITALKRLDVLFIHDFEPNQLTQLECYWLSNLLDARKVAGGLLISSTSTPDIWCKQSDDVGLNQRIQAVIEPDLIRFEFVRINPEEAHHA